MLPSWKACPFARRLERLSELLDEEGFNAEVERRGDEVIIRELSCPYFQIGQQHPEVCLIDQSFIARALSLPVERVRCLLEGDAHCAFSVPLEGMPEMTENENPEDHLGGGLDASRASPKRCAKACVQVVDPELGLNIIELGLIREAIHQPGE